MIDLPDEPRHTTLFAISEYFRTLPPELISLDVVSGFVTAGGDSNRKACIGVHLAIFARACYCCLPNLRVSTPTLKSGFLCSMHGQIWLCRLLNISPGDLDTMLNWFGAQVDDTVSPFTDYEWDYPPEEVFNYYGNWMLARKNNLREQWEDEFRKTRAQMVPRRLRGG